MRQYRTEKKELNELDKIICNKCGKEIKVTRGVEKCWGYFSNKDNQEDRFELCEDCYDELVASFKFKI